MGGVVCVIILDGNNLQGDAKMLAQTAAASCQLVDYLENDVDANFNSVDAQAIADFHAKTKVKLTKMNQELEDLNRALAAKYNR